MRQRPSSSLCSSSLRSSFIFRGHCLNQLVQQKKRYGHLAPQPATSATSSSAWSTASRTCSTSTSSTTATSIATSNNRRTTSCPCQQRSQRWFHQQQGHRRHQFYPQLVPITVNETNTIRQLNAVTISLKLRDNNLYQTASINNFARLLRQLFQHRLLGQQHTDQPQHRHAHLEAPQ